jgi:hypothetical protein
MPSVACLGSGFSSSLLPMALRVHRTVLILALSILDPGTATTTAETAMADEARSNGCHGARRWLKLAHIPVLGLATTRAIVENSSRPGFQQLTTVSAGTISSMDM